MTKSELRQEFLTKRRALTAVDIRRCSHQVASYFFTYFEHQKLSNEPGFIHTFLPIRRHNEVDTWLIIRKIWSECAHIGVSVPVINPDTRQMTHYTIYADTPLIENKLGIPEPAPEHRHKTDLSRIVTVLVPLLTFDQQGHRVGYGGGYYDRFLAENVPNSQKIGLSLFGPVEQIDGIEPTDVRLDRCITPEQMLAF